ncbi:MAG TPA: hypothetical protein VFE33_01830 [Thermoanaerobaculia bacterium]|nr:hypothetical protein [Thermoanaerobaculia bacterium]
MIPSTALRGALVALVLLLVPAAVLRSQVLPPDSRAMIETEIRLERRLLGRDLAAYAQARAVEQRERGRFDTAAARLDQLLTGGNLTIESFENLDNEVRGAAESARAAADRALELRQRAGERLRRIGALQEELAGRSAPRDPVSGHWRVRIGPGDHTGTFDLHLDGTLVTGRYALNDGAAGSLTGTYVSGTLRLQRVDTQRGLDVTYTGTLDPAAGRLTGAWQGTELANGTAFNGGWTAARQPATEP